MLHECIRPRHAWELDSFQSGVWLFYCMCMKVAGHVYALVLLATSHTRHTNLIYCHIPHSVCWCYHVFVNDILYSGPDTEYWSNPISSEWVLTRGQRPLIPMSWCRVRVPLVHSTFPRIELGKTVSKRVISIFNLCNTGYQMSRHSISKFTKIENEMQKCKNLYF